MKKKELCISIAESIHTPSGPAEKLAQTLTDVANVLSKKLHAELEMIHVDAPIGLEFSPFASKEILKNWKENLKNSLLARAKKISHATKTKLLEGDPAKELIQYAKKKKNSRILALATEAKGGLEKAFLGSITEEVIRQSEAPVLSINPCFDPALFHLKTANSPIHFVILTDLGANSRKAEDWGIAMASRLKASVTLFHHLFDSLHPVIQSALTSPHYTAELEDSLKKIENSALKKLQNRVLAHRKKKLKIDYTISHSHEGTASAVLMWLKQASTPQNTILVLGTRGRNALTTAFLGGTARSLISKSPVPMITLLSKKK